MQVSFTTSVTKSDQVAIAVETIHRTTHIAYYVHPEGR